LALDRDEQKKLLKEKGVKSLDDFSAFMREVSKEVDETLLDGELTDHLGFEKHDQKAKATDNTRNGFTPKTVKSKFGEIDLDVPRDRKSDFEPQIVKKRQKDIPAQIDFVCRLALCFLKMVGWDIRGDNAVEISAAQNQTFIRFMARRIRPMKPETFDVRAQKSQWLKGLLQ
jgi:hypothetical protein